MRRTLGFEFRRARPRRAGDGQDKLHLSSGQTVTGELKGFDEIASLERWRPQIPDRLPGFCNAVLDLPLDALKVRADEGRKAGESRSW